MKDPTFDIGAKIRQRRQDLEWSLEAAAAATGVSMAMLGQIERGESNPTMGVLWKIATGLAFRSPLAQSGPELSRTPTRFLARDTPHQIYAEAMPKFLQLIG